MQLHYDVHDGDGEPLLLLHGFLSSRAQWLDNLPGLTSFCTPITVELWGHGRSPMPDNDAQLHPQAYIEQFENIRREIGASRWYVVGHSFGAGLTLRYALNHPDSILGQAFCNSNSALEPTDGSNVSERGKEIRSTLLSGRPLTDLPVHPANAKRLPQRVKKALVEDARLLQPAALARCVKVTRPLLSVRDDFHQLSVPTLLINGVWEKGFQASARHAKDALPSLVEVPLEGGHAINAERVNEFNDAIQQHLCKCHSANKPNENN
jgi:pimeloyl-ACP methyl ester carboxylesterase